MQKLILKAPFNSLSFGQVSYNLTKALWRGGYDVSIFPQNETVDLNAYGSYIKPEFAQWFKERSMNRFDGVSKDTPCIHLWHIRGSELKITNQNNLFTFHELNGVTPLEKTICGLHERVMVSSQFSKDVFAKEGVATSVVNIGFDDDIQKLDKKYLPDTTHFGLVGKWEKRKNTEKIIKTWLKLFGNSRNHRLTCLVENPFLKPEQMKSLMSQALGGREWWNISFLPRLASNAEVVDFYNSIDVDLSGLSSAEGWNLPSFNATCLGKWSCVSNCTAHKDWATPSNCVLVEPSGEIDPWDGVFFQKGTPYNQGTVYEISETSIEGAIIKAEKLAKKPNPEGEKLKSKFSYENTLNQILNCINQKPL